MKADFGHLLRGQQRRIGLTKVRFWVAAGRS
ncbi:MAG: hypothetical protein ACJAWY_000877 [Sphingomonas echinoides]|jgi:hypothetical protein